MTSMLRAGRILSSDESNAITQTQETNVNIKVQQHPSIKNDQGQPQTHGGGITYQTSYPSVHPTGISPNFTSAGQNDPSSVFTVPPMEASSYQSVQPTSNQSGIEELESRIDELSNKNEFLELLLSVYKNNPLKVNSIVIADNKLFMKMVKLLSGADRVELILDENLSCECGCSAGASELIYVSKILITLNGKTEDLKYCRNDVYSTFIKHNISTKIVSQ